MNARLNEGVEPPAAEFSLDRCRPGWCGTIVELAVPAHPHYAGTELERRLLEMGFVEGARVEVRHEGPLGRDPMAVLIDNTLIAVRRRDAAVILVKAEA
ncbi:ferrous iron transport protein A [Dongia sp.]|uniref:FeoA family protein n=1 Tax=Dongia sp. TaxID=1977262 RepID=UPI0035B12078